MPAKQVLGFTSLGLFTATLAAGLSFSAPAEASCLEYMGQASNGKPIKLDQCSISRVDHRFVDFSYKLGYEKLYARANCNGRFWRVNGVRHYPGSYATQQMIDRVCDPDNGGVVYYKTKP
ncbi:hypothetical protein K9N68_28850 [Kovacikia minuta CCNUW1]|uniref:hypothetical protein n=1 Tax=Kovacikia minuta TaxID=2931930 RepID=UPI001CC989BB|nr:hypothetical protein [Kovacikia minuta]UBF25541.1 hypothetical protein K9N68_28850 [Kovacikia minuta CCNUW1]